MRRLLGVLLFVLILAQPAVWAGKIHFYVDEQGNKVFYNIPSPPAETITSAVAATPVPVSPLQQRASLYDDLIMKHAGRHSVDPVLVKAVMGVESAYNPRARSNKDAHGLMQLIPGTARRFGVRNIYDPSENIEGGVKYLRFLIDMFHGDLNLVLASYNAGENRVARVKGIPRIRETQDYVAKITRVYGATRTQLAGAGPIVEAAAAPAAPVFRIVRTTDAQGNVILTNRPTRVISSTTTVAAGSL